MKVLLFITSLSQNDGGPSRSVPIMAKGLSEVGIDVTLMTISTDNMNVHALEGSEVKFVVLRGKITRGVLETEITRGRFDIVQLQSLWSLVYHDVALICRKHHIPYIITPRGMLEPWSLRQKKWKKRMALFLYQKKDLNRAACIYSTSEMEANHVRSLGIKAPISVIPNGIETEGYPCRNTIDDVKKQVLFLSRIHKKKGIELLINAWGSIVETFPKWKLLIVGNGEISYVNSLRQRISDKHLCQSVEILPPVFGDEKLGLYHNSSLFVLPSYSENFGMVIAEAMSCGLPVITTDNTPWKILNDTNTGWCIPLSEERLFSTLYVAMSLSKKSLYQMGQKASIIVNENFNYKSVALKTKELYESILR